LAGATWGELVSLAREIIDELRGLFGWMERRGIYECYDDGAAVCDPEATWCWGMEGEVRVGDARLFQEGFWGMCCAAYGSGSRLTVDGLGEARVVSGGTTVVAADVGRGPERSMVFVMAGTAPGPGEEPDLREMFRGFSGFEPVETGQLLAWLGEALRAIRKARASCAEGERRARRLLAWMRAGP